MAKFGCPPIFIAMVRQFHDGMQVRVQNNQHDVFCYALTDAFRDCDAGFPIRYRFDGTCKK